MFESSAHVGEDAELYALGQLDESQQERFELHVSSCTECARRAGEAESTVLRLIEAAPVAMPAALRPFTARGGSSFGWRWAAAIAAAFVLGLLPWLVTQRSASPPTEQLAMTAMLNGHFQHTQFVSDEPNAPRAKVIYGRSGGWIYVLAGAGNAALSVVTVQNETKATVATLAPSAQTRSVYVALPSRIDRVLLVENGRPVAHANVAFATPAKR